MSDSNSTEKVNIVVRLYDEDPVAELEIPREKTLDFMAIQTNAHLHNITKEVLRDSVRVSPGQKMIFDPSCITNRPLADQLEQNCHTINAYVPVNIGAIKILKENVRLEKKQEAELIERREEREQWEARLEAERKEDKMEQEAERKKEHKKWEELEAERKREREELEAERKREREELEAERKREREELEAERKREREELEAERKREREELKAERKQEREELKAERKQERKKWEDLQAERKKEQRKFGKLEVDFKAAQRKLGELEEEREKELQAREAEHEKHTQEIQELQAQISDHTTFLADDDQQALDRIKLRNIIDHAQAKLAEVAGLTKSSFVWRDCLPEGTITARLQTAKGLLQDQKLPSVSALLASDVGMKLVVERHSQIRQGGDAAAHEHVTNRIHASYQDIIARTALRSEETRAGLMVLLDFICAID